MRQVVHTALFARGAPDTRARRGAQVWLPGEALENVRLRRLRQHVYGKFRFYEASARISPRDWENLEGAEKWRVCSENKRWYNWISYDRGNILLVIDSWWSCKRYNLLQIDSSEKKKTEQKTDFNRNSFQFSSLESRHTRETCEKCCMFLARVFF